MATAAPEPFPTPGDVLIVVPGGGEARFDLAPGDRVRIIDPEGLQPGMLVRHGPDGDETVALFGDAAGAEHRFTAEAAMTVTVLAPGAPMAPEAQDVATDLHVRIARADPASDLPPPLGVPLLDLRVPAASARAYRVRAGDYIQIIDVAGRQCSDFVAFDAAALDRGEERGLDATVTRSLMGRSFSSPGLHARYFDAALRPLVEVVQDTVGRHDTFLLACTAKYYEDQGYPGHSNCTENFNLALVPHGIAPRAGWRRFDRHGRALVATGRLCLVARADRSGLRVVGLPRRYRPGQRLESDRHPRPPL